ncbi:rhomboid family protein [Methyloglobulus morosus KoM1]|uniref:Rhomboid family protein n=1 Tax=Methyloglobulus morosus KoM1 TaxID=1116472 RepID=V5BWL4_9GAMM|nr:rhomboid family intramembrane serine protease [Methyloglobulus morosus]ESS72249.1 rhomboid family protein [Methyloglobulus morosus KoM1]
MIPIRDTAPCNSTPYMTWSLMAVCIAIFLVMQVMPYELSYKITYLYGMVPNRYANPQWGLAYGLPFDGYLSFLTSLFLHGNWLHIIFNMWFMWIFADNIEDRMGKWRFLAFYLICGVLATMLQWYSTPTLVIPVVGASGAIAGVMAAYYFLYPFEGVIVYFFPIVVRLPAVTFLGLWVIFQLYSITTSTYVPGATSDSALWAHVGGFIAGAILHRFFLRKDEVV